MPPQRSGSHQLPPKPGSLRRDRTSSERREETIEERESRLPGGSIAQLVHQPFSLAAQGLVDRDGGVSEVADVSEQCDCSGV